MRSSRANIGTLEQIVRRLKSLLRTFPHDKRYRDNLRDELNGAALYAALAAAEADPLRKDLFLQLSQAEASHALGTSLM